MIVLFVCKGRRRCDGTCRSTWTTRTTRKEWNEGVLKCIVDNGVVVLMTNLTNRALQDHEVQQDQQEDED